jgi:hypothetical protein
LCASGKRCVSSNGSSHGCSDTPGIWTRRFFKIHTTTSRVRAEARPGRLSERARAERLLAVSSDAVKRVRHGESQCAGLVRSTNTNARLLIHRAVRDGAADEGTRANQRRVIWMMRPAKGPCGLFRLQLNLAMPVAAWLGTVSCMA